MPVYHSLLHIMDHNRVNGTIILFMYPFQFSKTVQTKNVMLREKIIRNRYVSIKNIFSSQKNIFVYPRIFFNRSLKLRRHFCDLSKSEQRLSLVLIMIAVIFILSSLPRIIIMMYDVIIIDTIRSKAKQTLSILALLKH